MSRPEDITVLIADDEPLGRELLRHMLARHRDVRIVAECSDGEKALSAIGRHSPRLAFLDIKMPRLDGMTLLERLQTPEPPLVVFVTAHDAYAIRAFQAHAFDYLLKPFEQERFDQVVDRARGRLAEIEQARLGQRVRRLLSDRAPHDDAHRDPGPGRERHLDRIVIRESGRVYFVEAREINWLEASGNYVGLHVASGKIHLVHETMGNLEARLDPAVFVRIHRSTMVNVGAIKELQPHFNGEYVVLLNDNSRVKLSRSYLATARKALGLA